MAGHLANTLTVTLNELSNVQSAMEQSPFDLMFYKTTSNSNSLNNAAVKDYVTNYCTQVYKDAKHKQVKQWVGGFVDYSKISKRIAELDARLEQLAKPLGIPKTDSTLPSDLITASLPDDEDFDEELAELFSEYRVRRLVEQYMRKVTNIDLKNAILSPPASPLMFTAKPEAKPLKTLSKHRVQPVATKTKDRSVLKLTGTAKAQSQRSRKRLVERQTIRVRSISPTKKAPTESVTAIEKIHSGSQTAQLSRVSEPSQTIPLAFDAGSQTATRNVSTETVRKIPQQESQSQTAPTSLVERVSTGVQAQAPKAESPNPEIAKPVKTFIVPSTFIQPASVVVSVNDDDDEFVVPEFNAGVIGFNAPQKTAVTSLSPAVPVSSNSVVSKSTSPIPETHEAAVETAPEQIVKGTQVTPEPTSEVVQIEPQQPVSETSTWTPWMLMDMFESQTMARLIFDAINELVGETIAENYGLIIKCIEEALDELKSEQEALQKERDEWERQMRDASSQNTREQQLLRDQLASQRSELSLLSGEIASLKQMHELSLRQFRNLEFAREEAQILVQQVVYEQLREAAIEALFEMSKPAPEASPKPFKKAVKVKKRPVKTTIVQSPAKTLAEKFTETDKPSEELLKNIAPKIKKNSRLDKLPIEVVRLPAMQPPVPAPVKTVPDDLSSSYSALSTVLSEGEVLADLHSEGEIFIRHMDRVKIGQVLDDLDRATSPQPNAGGTSPEKASTAIPPSEFILLDAHSSTPTASFSLAQTSNASSVSVTQSAHASNLSSTSLDILIDSEKSIKGSTNVSSADKDLIKEPLGSETNKEPVQQGDSAQSSDTNSNDDSTTKDKSLDRSSSSISSKGLTISSIASS